MSARTNVNKRAPACMPRLHFDDLHRSGIYSWELLHDLGRNKWAIKRSYIQRLRQQGLRRDPASLTQRKGTVANLSS